MAKQNGLIKLTGELDGYIFYQNKHGSLVRAKGNVTTERRQTGVEFENTRLSNKDFKYASRVGKLIRRGVKETPMVIELGDTNTRLVKALRRVMDLDKTHKPGERAITTENADLLRGFEWNVDAPVLANLRTGYNLNIDTDNNRVSFGIKGFNVKDMVHYGERVTHVDLILCVTAVDYEGDWEVSKFDGAGALSVTEKKPIDLLLECAIPENEGELIVVGLGIQMYMEVSGWMNKVRTGSGYVLLGAVMLEPVV